MLKIIKIKKLTESKDEDEEEEENRNIVWENKSNDDEERKIKSETQYLERPSLITHTRIAPYA